MVRQGLRALVLAGGLGLVVSAVLAITLPHPLGTAAGVVWVAGAVMPTYVLGAFALAMRPNHLAARWLAAAGSLIALQTAANRLLSLADALEVAWWTAGAGLAQVLALATAASVGALLVIFPDPAYRRGYQRRITLGLWAVVVALPVALAVSRPHLLFSPFAAPESPIPNPLFVPWLSALAPVAETAFRWRAVLWLVGVAAMATRYAAAPAAARKTFQWPLAAAAMLTLFAGAFRFLEQVDAMPAGLRVVLLFGGWVPGLAVLAATILVAVLRHRLIGVELGLRRSILSGGVSVLIVLAHLGVAGLAGRAAGHRVSIGVGVSVALATVVALDPVRRALEQRARRWVFGPSLPGSELLRRVGSTLEDAYDTTQVATNLAETVVDGLGPQWARVLLQSDDGARCDPVAAVGVGTHDPTPDLVVPLVHAGTSIGMIEVGPKTHGELSPADEGLLSTVAGQAALAILNARLAAELEDRLAELDRQAHELAASRGRLVQAQMAERRRIERNIHDGVQQEIVAAMAKIRLSRNQLARDPQVAEATLGEVQDDARRILENVRELSRGIYPLVLTHRGLVEALVAQMSHSPLDVKLEIQPDVRGVRFGEEVEAAAYFVVTEGLTNVLKHAGTKEAMVRLRTAKGRLLAEVVDHGRGCNGVVATGSGITGLRDRVTSIGGELEFESRPGEGLTLRAALPVPAERTRASHA